ncbi:Nicotinate-nucleotide pyrophosphorylase [gamma proteobacterium HdN1]|nr:Nicotinate-nucleotide pyrophosphorylase [gamma proteobacterium HdN1]
MNPNTYLQSDIPRTVAWALEEDIRDGDITARLIAENTRARATLITREDAVICGVEWVNEVFKQLSDGSKSKDSQITITWHVKDGDKVSGDTLLAEFEGPARLLLSGERTALNFLQTLSATATVCRRYADMVEGTGVKLLDTRKTLPGLRTAQKYAVTCGGCYNHRIGLYDAFLIKENHIMACGGIAQAIRAAHAQAPGKPVEIEVENLDEVQQALDAGADIIMLDDMSIEDSGKAVRLNNHRARLEISGGVSADRLRALAETGVDFISIGGLTKHIQAVDLSMRVRA